MTKTCMCVGWLGTPPKGFGKWTLQLLAEQLVTLEVVDSICPETVRKTQKNSMTKRMIDYWVIPRENDAKFVACMEEVLETYEKPYAPANPAICMDEQPVQLLKKTRVAIEATKNHPKRVDYEYERNGTASIFMFTEPLSGFSASDRS
jgi:hypothetical protein